MSMVLSIYSQKGFREVTLPDRHQTFFEILIQKELFGLENDVGITLEKTEGAWRLQAPGTQFFQGKKALKTDAVSIRDGLKFEIETGRNRRITVICFERSEPFSVYRKYSLEGLHQIKIGRDAGNEIRYENEFVSGKHCTISLHNGMAVLRDESKNGTYLNFNRVYGSTVLHYGDSIRIMRLNIIYLGNMIAVLNSDHFSVSIPEMSAADLTRLAATGTSTDQNKILFHRSPRNLRKLHTEPFEIEAPPNPPDQQEMPLAMVIGPSMSMAIPMLLSTGITVWASRSGGAYSGAFMYMGIVTAIASALVATVWALVNVRFTSKQKREAENRRFEKYSEYLLRMRDKLDKACRENTNAMKERYLSADECCSLDEHSALLWNRNESHEDYLSIRLGIGDAPFQAPIVIPKERFSLINDTLADKPQMLHDNFSTLHEVPVTVNLMKNRLLGIAGGENRKKAQEIAKAMIAQIAASNCYTDVKIAVVYDEKSDIDRGAWDFALWLPHVWSSDKKIRYIATNHSEKGDVFHALIQILRMRSEDERKDGKVYRPRFVLFVADPRLLDGEAISHYVFDRDNDLGLSTVLLAGRPEELPNECESIVRCDEVFQGVYDAREGMKNGIRLQFDPTNDETLCSFAKALGRIEVIDTQLEGEIPNTLTFFDMYGVGRPEELNAPERWRRSDIISSMKALVGFRTGNNPCYLDIHERYHGPHGLVAGTTGSGKSETLQTYILSLAVNYSPEDIGFFVIDYKGGGMANLFDGLPHMIGSISNLSGNQVQRAMVSIQSENRRRQKIFAEYGVNNINGYTSLFKTGDASEPVPHLFIIIDEFAELKREEPDFMKELISVAQVGRSLGVHLILSTQRPSGTVDENIWANSKFRLCLRVQDRQDSMDMLHRTEAAYLTQAGRCYLQVGNDEIFELFQSGWSGADYDDALGGSSLQIAQMLSATGKVDLAGNHARLKHKEERRHRWIQQMIQILRQTEQETDVSVMEAGFQFENHRNFMSVFYRNLQAVQPEFEENQFNSVRINDFCQVYQELFGKVDEEQLADEILRYAAKTRRRLPEMKTRSQLEVTVDYLSRTAQSQGISQIRKLWLPVLPEYLYLDNDCFDAYKQNAFDGVDWPQRKLRQFRLNAIIGMADDPANQDQMPVSVDFAEGGHHMVIGTVSTGKSTFLQTVIYSMASMYTPEMLNIYCLDFSAKLLSVFSDLKHVGGYMDESDLDGDRISKFFTLITRILDERKRLFAGASYEDYVNHNGWTLPAVLIVIDNYGSFHEKTGETYEAIMMRIAKEGNGCGIYLMVSAGGIGMQELPGRLAETFRTGISLEMPDPFAYADVLRVVKPPVLPESRVKGRGLLYYGERILEFQTALAAHAEGGPERSDLLKEAVERMNAAWDGMAARPIPSIPEKPVRADFISLPEYEQKLQELTCMPLGYDYEYAEIWSFNLVQNCVFLITGTKQSGKSVCMENLMQTGLDRGDELLIIELEDDRFERFAQEHEIRRYTDGQSVFECCSYLQREMVARAGIKKACIERRASDEELFQAALENRRIDVFVGNLSALFKALYDVNSPAYNAHALFETLCERAKGYNIFLFAEVSDREQTELMGYNSFESMRNYRSGIRFGGRLNEQKIFAFENIHYQEQDRATKAGVGIIPNDNRDARVERVVGPFI